MKNFPLTFSSVFSVLLGIICLLTTISLSFYYKNELGDLMLRTTPAVPDGNLTVEVRKLENEIQVKETVVNTEKSLAKMDGVLPNSESDLEAKTDKRAAKIQKLEAEIVELKLKLEEFKKLEQESIGKAEPEFKEKYNIQLLTLVVSLGIPFLFLAYSTFLDALPSKNGAVANFERKCRMFLFTCISFSVFGFTAFLWYLSI